MHTVRVIDSHTEGEPTRVVVEGGPDLGGGSVADKARVLAERFDWFRSAVVCEPRGSEVMVGALVVEADPLRHSKTRDTSPAGSGGGGIGAIFFNNVGLLNMCVHGTIGLGITLAHSGKIGPGEHTIETPVGDVTMRVGGKHDPVAVRNVPSYRSLAKVAVEVPGIGPVHGDVAWGGNWFFLCENHGERIAPDNIERLTSVSWAIRRELTRRGIRGDDGREIDHVELFGPATRSDCHSKNFVLCPGGAYDRSPCGTGTSAKIACLAAAGKLKRGEVWRQESVIGSVFEGRYEWGGEESGASDRGTTNEPSPGSKTRRPLPLGEVEKRIIPTITGRAWITGEATLMLDESDPFKHGIRP